MKTLFIFILILSSIDSLQAKMTKGSVSFLAKGKPAFITIEGKGQLQEKSSTLTEEKVSLTLLLPVSSLESGIELRDSHLKEKYLEIEKFPEITLTLNDHVLSATTFKASLTLHGVTRDISGSVKTDQSGEAIEIDAEFEVNLDEFSIEIPSFQGITVAKTVKIRAQISLQR